MWLGRLGGALGAFPGRARPLLLRPNRHGRYSTLVLRDLFPRAATVDVLDSETEGADSGGCAALGMTLVRRASTYCPRSQLHRERMDGGRKTGSVRAFDTLYMMSSSRRGL